MDKNKTNENISNSIKIGFETLSNSLVECALILSSEDYAKSVIKERATKKEKEEEKKKSVKEKSEKFLNIYKEKLKEQFRSINIPDDEKSELFNSLITNEVSESNNNNTDIDISIKEISPFVKKAFCDTLKEVKPEFEKMFIGDSINFDPMMLSMIIPEVELPRLTYIILLLNEKNKMSSIDPMMFVLMNNKPF